MSVGVLALLAAIAPPVGATTIVKTGFIANLILNGPLGAPFNPNDQGLPTIPIFPPNMHCALPLVGLPNVPPANCHLDWGGHNRGIVGLTNLVCVNTGENIAKLNKAPFHGGFCGLGLAPAKPTHPNAVHGFCGLSGGQLQLFFTDALQQTYLLDLHFTVTGTALTVWGHGRKLTNPTPPQPTSLFFGTGSAVPVPVVGPVPVGNSCAASTATQYTIAGAFAFATTEMP